MLDLDLHNERKWNYYRHDFHDSLNMAADRKLRANAYTELTVLSIRKQVTNQRVAIVFTYTGILLARVRGKILDKQIYGSIVGCINMLCP